MTSVPPDDSREARRISAVSADTDGQDGYADRDRVNVGDRQRVLEAEKARFGGMKFFTAFFGWLTATGTIVLLSALITGIAAALGLGDQVSTATSGQNAGTTTLVSSIVLGVIILIGYYAGGYVAGRMARFSGLKQGLAVWLWLVLITIVVAIIGAVTANNLDLFSQLGSVPNLGNLTGAGAIAAAAAAILALIGALLGGLAGMRWHRKVDRADLNA